MIECLDFPIFESFYLNKNSLRKFAIAVEYSSSCGSVRPERGEVRLKGKGDGGGKVIYVGRRHYSLYICRTQ